MRCAAKMAEAYSTTIFDQLSVALPPPVAPVPPRKPETEMNSRAMSDDRRWVRSNEGGGGGGRWRASTGDRRARTGASRLRRWRKRRAAAETAAETTSFVGLMQQLSVDGRELFELAERGGFDDVVDSTATKDVSGGPVTFTSPAAYLSLTSVTQSSTFSISFRV